MAQSKPHPAQKFFWQGALILLLVVVMAGFGFWAILRERLAVEQEAQHRAKEILQALPDDFFWIAANRLTQLNGPKGGWYQHLQRGLSPWPENQMRKQWLADTNESRIISNHLEVLRKAYPIGRAGRFRSWIFRGTQMGVSYLDH
jgi:hypothetical protein